MITFEKVLEMVTQLPKERQEMLGEIVKKWTIDARRQEMLKPMSATKAIAELRFYLEDNDEE